MLNIFKPIPSGRIINPLKHLAEITGRYYDEHNIYSMELLRRIERKSRELYNKMEKNGICMTTKDIIFAAEKLVSEEGNRVFSDFVETILTPPRKRELKIKSSPKGIRITEPSEDGIRYSYGPIWNTSLVTGKGVAFFTPSRAKLEHHGKMVGIENPKRLSTRELVSEIVKTFNQ